MRGRNIPKSARAQSLRAARTGTETALWYKLRDRRLSGHKFTRQHPIGSYFADFCCRQAMLVVELDGSQHIDSAYDARRDNFMIAQGYRVLRFWNADVREDISSVCETIIAAIDGRLDPYERYRITRT